MKTSTIRSAANVLFLGLMLVTAACDKNKDVVTPEENASLPCAGKNLRLTALNFDPALDLDGDGKVENDLLGYMPDCALDNTINFEKSGKLSGSEGSKVCPSDGDDSPVEVGASTWTYDPKTSTLRIIPNGKPAEANEWKVKEVTANRIKASIVTESEDGDKLSMVMTWSAQ